ncbi:MAG TPA: DUF6468 domain-containing protein [Caulobacteraceae bacterium]|nr:DUF6468 domain-containing protein [Caulobacteraceae bacterium]
MSDIGLIMNGLLGVLLVGALFVGWRLEGRLKALRASHQSFTEAVHDLDRAAARAEQGLADLRAATDEAAESLAGRIERAGLLAQRLERLTADAIAAESRHAEAPRPAAVAPTREVAAQRFSERYAGPRAAPAAASSIAQAAARNDLILDDDESAPARRAATPRRLAPVAPANDRLERLRALARPKPAAAAARPRPIEEDLFDAPEPRRAMGGAR